MSNFQEAYEAAVRDWLAAREIYAERVDSVDEDVNSWYDGVIDYDVWIYYTPVGGGRGESYCRPGSLQTFLEELV